MPFDASTAEPVAAQEGFDPESATLVRDGFDPETATLDRTQQSAPKKQVYQIGEEAPGMQPGEAAAMKDLNRGMLTEGSFEEKRLKPAIAAGMTGVELPDVKEGSPLQGALESTLEGQVVSGLYKGGVKPLVNALTAPVTLALAPLGIAEAEGSTIAQIINKAATAYFAGDTAQAGGEKAAKVVEVLKDPNATTTDKVAAITDAAGTLGFSGIMAAHTAKPVRGAEPIPAVDEGEAGRAPTFVPQGPPAPPTFDPASAEPVRAGEPLTSEPLTTTTDVAPETKAREEFNVEQQRAETERLKNEAVDTALKDPETTIQYNVWDRNGVPEGKSRVLQVDLPSPNAPETAGARNYTSTSLDALRAKGLDLPEPPESLSAGRYTLQEIKDAIAREAKPEETIPAEVTPAVGKEVQPELPNVNAEFNLASEEQRAAEAPAEPTETNFDLFNTPEVQSFAPTPLDEANRAARETPQPAPMSAADRARMRAEEQANLEQAFPKGTELLDAVRGMLPRPEDAQMLKGELQGIWDNLVKQREVGEKIFKSGGKQVRRKAYTQSDALEAAKFFAAKGGKGTLDDVRQALNEKGFNFATPADMLSAIDDSMRGNKLYADEGSALNPQMGENMARPMLVKGGPTPVPVPTVDNSVLATMKARADAARETLRKLREMPSTKLGRQSGAVINPELLAKYIKAWADIGAYHLARGVVDSAEWAKAMISDIGDEIRPYLKRVREMSERQHEEDMGGGKVQPQGVTATKNAQVDAEREARGLPPAMQAAKREFGAVWDEAMRTLDEHPKAAEDLVRELKDKPRAITDTENALLLHRQIELQNEFDRVSERINQDQSKRSVDDIEFDQARNAVLSDELLDIYNVNKSVGTETGRGLNARKMLANQDYSLAEMVTARRAARGGRELTPEELEETKKLQEKIAATQKAFDDYRAKVEAEGPPKQKTVFKRFAEQLKPRADAALARLEQKLAGGAAFSTPLDPTILRDLAEVAAYHVAKGADWAVELGKRFGEERIKPHLEAIKGEMAKLADELAGADPRLKAFKTRATKKIAELKERTAAHDFSPKEKPPPLVLDDEALRLKSELNRAQQAYQETLLKDRLAGRSKIEKAQDTLVKWRRGFLLSNPVTLAKLTAAAVQRYAFTPLEEAAGAVIGKAIPGIAERAPRQGGLNIQAEAKAITEGLTKGMQDAYELLRTGKTTLEVLFGKGREGGVREHDVTPRAVIDMFGQIHGALKSPVKRAEFARSLEKRIAFAMRNGVDVTDPMVQTRLMVESYKDANASIFLQDNVVVNAWNRGIGALLEKQKATGRPSPAGRAIATTAKVLLPIVRVPTNIVAETVKYAAGSVTGSWRVARALKMGVDTLKPDEADLIMQELKKGSIGAAALLIGYFNADKVGGYYQSNQKKSRNPNDPTFGSMRIGQVNIPSYLLHNPLLETVQIGATIKRVAETKIHRHDAGAQGIGSGAWAGALGLMEQVPFVRQQVETAKMLDTREGPYARQKFVKGLVVPAAVDFTARHLDTDAQGNPVNRKAVGYGQTIESGIPGLRQTLPIKR